MSRKYSALFLISVAFLIGCPKKDPDTPPEPDSRRLFLEVNVSSKLGKSDLSREFAIEARSVILNPKILSELLGGSAEVGEKFFVNPASGLEFEAETAELIDSFGQIQQWLLKPSNAVFSGMIKERNLVALIEVGNRRFRVHPGGSGDEHLVTEIDVFAYPERDDGVVPPSTGVLQENSATASATLCDQKLPFPVPPGKGPRIRVMVLWTPAARAESFDIRRDVLIAMDSLSRAMKTPNFIVYPELAHMQEISFVESPSMRTDLDRLTDGAIPGVHALRDQHRADLVAVLTAHRDYCGMAWINERLVPGATGTHGFSISSRQCAISNETFAHEIGHNMGMRHDRETDSGGTVFPYNHGFIIHSRRLRSIMAYNRPCARRGYNCQRVSSYSAPQIRFKTDSLGQLGVAHNLEVLCRHAPIVERFRP